VTSLGNPDQQEKPADIYPSDVNKYFSLRDIQGICREWQENSKRWIKTYLDYVSWRIDEDKTLSYCKQVKEASSITYYRKQIYQIRRFLEYLKIDWASQIKLPPEPEYLPKRVSSDAIGKILDDFKDQKYVKQIKALILLGCSSGLRAEELYQLTPMDIDLDNRVVRINHNPENGQTTKTHRSRISFFNIDAQKALSEYLDYFNNGNGLEVLFGHSHLSPIFKDSPVKIKDFRKYFSQEWDRRGGPTSIKKILMGHSLRNDVDLMHYNAQSEEDLKAIYDRVMNNNMGIAVRMDNK
jgi:integrase/recombinase XerD